MRESTKAHFRQVESLPEPQPDAAPTGKVRVIVLASGSKGNAILIAYGHHPRGSRAPQPVGGLPAHQAGCRPADPLAQGSL